MYCAAERRNTAISLAVATKQAPGRITPPSRTTSAALRGAAIAVVVTQAARVAKTIPEARERSAGTIRIKASEKRFPVPFHHITESTATAEPLPILTIKKGSPWAGTRGDSIRTVSIFRLPPYDRSESD